VISVDLSSPAAPDTILAALRAHAGEWRQPHIPPELWRDGVATIECRVRAATCTVTVFRRWNGKHVRVGLVRGEAAVEATHNGSIVHVRIGYAVAGTELLTIGFGIWTLVGFVVYGKQALILVGLADAFISVGFLWTWFASQRLVLGQVAEADYVLHRITAAVDTAGHPAAAVPDPSP
jgi:hypothetical protein